MIAVIGILFGVPVGARLGCGARWPTPVSSWDVGPLPVAFLVLVVPVTLLVGAGLAFDRRSEPPASSASGRWSRSLIEEPDPAQPAAPLHEDLKAGVSVMRCASAPSRALTMMSEKGLTLALEYANHAPSGDQAGPKR